MGNPAKHPYLGLVVVCLGTSVATLDSAVNIALPSITAAFGVGMQDVRWIVICYVLTYSSLLLIFGKLGDLFGYRLVFRSGLIVAAVGFGACAFAPTYPLLLAGRMLQGVGIALTLSCAPALATTLFSETERTRVLGIYAAAMAAGTALGPIAGGFMVAWFGWSAVFWTRAPIVVAALLLSFGIPAETRQNAPRALDFTGALLLVTWVAALLLGFASLTSAVNDTNTLTAGLAALAAVAFVGFILHERRHPEPIIRPSLFSSVDFTAINIISIAINYAAFAILMLVPYYLTGVRGLEPAFGGLMLALAAVGTVGGSWLAGRLAAHVVVGKLVLVGIVANILGLASVAFTARLPGMIPVALSLLLQGIGIGLFTVAYSDRVLAVLPIQDRGVAGSLSMVTRTIGHVAGASGHVLVHGQWERNAIASGSPEIAAFLIGFEAAFTASTLVAVAALVLALCRPGTWR